MPARETGTPFDGHLSYRCFLVSLSPTSFPSTMRTFLLAQHASFVRFLSVCLSLPPLKKRSHTLTHITPTRPQTYTHIHTLTLSLTQHVTQIASVRPACCTVCAQQLLCRCGGRIAKVVPGSVRRVQGQDAADAPDSARLGVKLLSFLLRDPKRARPCVSFSQAGNCFADHTSQSSPSHLDHRQIRRRVV